MRDECVYVSMSSYYDRGDRASGGGANRLAEIFGTEKDRVNCPFYLKIGGMKTGGSGDHVCASEWDERRNGTGTVVGGNDMWRGVWVEK